LSRAAWPYKLRILLKAGWTELGLSTAVNVSVDRVREYLSGIRTPEPHTAIEFEKILLAHRRAGLGLVPPRKEADARIGPTFDGPTSPLPEGDRRGVYESPCPPEGYRSYEGVAEDGTLLFEVRVHHRAEERDIVPGLRAWLNRADPIIRLASSDRSSS